MASLTNVGSMMGRDACRPPCKVHIVTKCHVAELSLDTINAVPSCIDWASLLAIASILQVQPPTEHSGPLPLCHEMGL